MNVAETPVILIAACGNRLAGDDAFGPLVAERLMREPRAGVEVVDLGMRPAGLIDHLSAGKRRAVILVDAAVGGGVRRGPLLEFDFFAADRPALCADRLTSTHAFSLAGQLELARALGMLPAVVRVVALMAEETRVGTPGRAAAGAADAAAALIRRRVEMLEKEWREGQKK
jgi:hydrogenase maturation protease